MEFSCLKYVLVKIERLKEHEGIDPAHLEALMEEVRSDGYLERPIVADLNTYIILDGHHRLHSLKRLGCSLMPAYLVDYNAPEIVVHAWREGERITKEEVIRAGLTGSPLPPKTTRHMVRIAPNTLVHISHLQEVVKIPLEKLRAPTL